MLTLRFFRTTLALILILFAAGCSLPAGISKPESYALKPDPTPYFYSAPAEHYLFLPSSYTPEREWPLFIGIHGSGGDGRQCLKWWQEAAEREGFVLLCPSLADENGGWYAEEGISRMRGILKQVRKECHIVRQYFLAGFSAGAEFVQILALDDPDSVQGVAMLSSGNYYQPPKSARTIPYLVVIGDQDNSISVGSAKEFARLLDQDGFSVESHLLPGIGHEVTGKALELTVSFYRKTAPR